MLATVRESAGVADPPRAHIMGVYRSHKIPGQNSGQYLMEAPVGLAGVRPVDY